MGGIREQITKEALNQNLYLDISGIKDFHGSKEGSIHRGIIQMFKYNEVKGISANNGKWHRVVFYTLNNNYEKAWEDIKEKYGEYGEIQEHIPSAVLEQRKRRKIWYEKERDKSNKSSKSNKSNEV